MCQESPFLALFVLGWTRPFQTPLSSGRVTTILRPMSPVPPRLSTNAGCWAVPDNSVAVSGALVAVWGDYPDTFDCRQAHLTETAEWSV